MAERDQSDVARSRLVCLTQGLVAGNEVAFCEFQSLYFDRLHRLLLVIARGDETQAREALQETMLRVARHPRVFADEDAFWAWLVTIARNAARDAGRKQSRYAALLARFTRKSDVDSQPVPREDAMSEALADCIETLPPADRSLIEGKYLDGQSVKDLATQSGLTEKAVESRLLRLRRQLRESILTRIKTP